MKHRDSCIDPVADTVLAEACFVHLQYYVEPYLQHFCMSDLHGRESAGQGMLTRLKMQLPSMLFL